MKKALSWIGSVLLSFTPACVSVHENVRVEEPTRRYEGQNVTQRCAEKIHPARLLWGKGARALFDLYPGWPVRIENQQQFDAFWAHVTVSADQLKWERQIRQELETAQPIRPIVNFDTSFVIAYAYEVKESCLRILPARVTTDCLTLFLQLSAFRSGDCGPTQDVQVQLFILPKTPLPIEGRWTDDTDGDGLSDESEKKLGTDPLDASSKI